MTTDLVTGRRAMTLWQRVRASYTMWIFYAGFTLFLPWAYVTTVGLPSLFFLIGILLIGHLFLSNGSWKEMAWFCGLTGVFLLYAFARSDFVDALRSGVNLNVAWAQSKQFFIAPMALWFALWAIIFGARSLSEAQASAVFKWFGYILLALAAIQAIEALSHFGLRQMLSREVIKSRDNMLIVGLSNTNMALLMMVWPLAMVQQTKHQIVPAVLVALAVIAAAITSDTNAHLLALIVSFAAFWLAKLWPVGWTRRGVTSERAAGGIVAAVVLVFPLIILWMIRTGLAVKIKTDLLPSWAARIDIWSYAVERAIEKPLWGWGYEASRWFDPMIPNHPHNMSLQAWLELGIPGLLMLAVFWGLVLWHMGGKAATAAPVILEDKGLRSLDFVAAPVEEAGVEARLRPYLIAQVVTYLVVGTLSYGIWRGWFYCLGAFAVVAAIIALKASMREIKLRN